jgi:peptidyl-prolyl cis-trans isomerase C
MKSRATVKPYHILVKHQYEADDLSRLLKSGKSFEELAKKYSICSSSQSGGFLGEVDTKRLDADFLECFESLKPGEVSVPLRTQFGWHLIKK